jgi:hypothetical protein
MTGERTTRGLLERRLLASYYVRALLISLSISFGLAAAPSLRAQVTAVALRAADARGRPFDLASLRGTVVAVTFVSRYTRAEAARVHDALRARADVKVVSVVDFVGIPGFVHGYARRKMAEADGRRVQHLCDERGELGRRFGARPDKRVDILVIDRGGGLRGHFAGAPQLDQALRLIDELRSATAER